MLRVTLSVRMECPWIEHLAETYGAHTKLLQCVPRAEAKGTSALATVNGISCSPESAAASVRALPLVEDAVFAATRRGSLLGIVRTRNCPCMRTALPGYHIAQVSSKAGGRMSWTLYVDGPKALRDIVTCLKESGAAFQLEEVRSVERAWHLSERQEQILRAALQLGLYEVPRKARLEDVARLFRVSPRAISEAMRRAHRQVVVQALEAISPVASPARPRKERSRAANSDDLPGA